MKPIYWVFFVLVVVVIIFAVFAIQKAQAQPPVIIQQSPTETKADVWSVVDGVLGLLQGMQDKKKKEDQNGSSYVPPPDSNDYVDKS